MVSYPVFYGVGIVVSLLNIILLRLVLNSQLKQFTSNRMNDRIKRALLVLTCAALLSNVVPIWFDVHQISIHAHPSNIGIAYTTSQYLFRTIVAFMLYLIYRF